MIHPLEVDKLDSISSWPVSGGIISLRQRAIHENLCNYSVSVWELSDQFPKTYLQKILQLNLFCLHLHLCSLINTVTLEKSKT